MKEFDLLVYIGRFQPPHNGHFHVVKEGLEKAHNVLVLIGSANCARNIRNPFTVMERMEMLSAGVAPDDRKRLAFAPINDFPYNESLWLQGVQTTVGNAIAGMIRPINPKKIGLIGYGKDGTSYYLKMFPQWRSVKVSPVNAKDGKVLSSTTLRQMMFDPNGLHGFNDLAPYMPASVVAHLSELSEGASDEARGVSVWPMLKAENAFVERYKRDWSTAPYKPTFLTVDAVVVQSGHVLMVTRKAEPGRGLLALPGGFLNQDERLLDAAIRELREETKLKIPVPVLKGSIVRHREFDDPHRSLRGRTVTTAYMFRLEDRVELPPVKGGDDAADAKWIPLSEIRPTHVYEDHYHILQTLLGGGS